MPFWQAFFQTYRDLVPAPYVKPTQLIAALTTTMLGLSGSGKTCFLAAMYNVMEAGVQGCTLSTRDLDQGAHLNEMFQTLRKGSAEERWPMGTRESTLFQFDFNLHHETLVTLEWLDYRGGALRDKSTEAEVQALLQHLGKSTAILISIDGEILQSSQGGLDADDSLGVKRINQFLKRTRDALVGAGRSLPLICLVITKGDALLTGGDEARAEAVRAAHNLYNSLTAEASGWEFLVTAVSLGEGLQQDKQRAINPIAVHEPACYIALRHYEREEEKRTRSLREELQDWLVFAERHREGDADHQRKLAEFVSYVNSTLQSYKVPLAKNQELLKSLCVTTHSLKD